MRIQPSAKDALPEINEALKNGLGFDPVHGGFDTTTGKLRILAAAAWARVNPKNVQFAVHLLIYGLKSEHYLHRALAASELAELGSEAKAAIPNLLYLLRDQDYRVRAAAHTALNKIDPDSAKKAP